MPSMNRSLTLLTTLALVTALNLSSAQTAQTTPPTLTIKHDEGSVTLKANPQRVVVLDEEALGWLAALGLSERVVGLGSSSLSPSEVNGTQLKPDVLRRGFYGRIKLKSPAYVGDWLAPNLESVTALRPDLIVRLTWQGNQNYANLSKIAPTIGYQESGQGFWQSGLRDLGRLFGRQTQAEAVIRQVVEVNRSNAKRLSAAGVFKTYPKVVVLAPFTGGTTYLYTEVRLIPDLRALGFTDGLSRPETTLGVGSPISDEVLLGLGKDTLVVLFPPDGKNNGVNAFQATAVGQRLKDQSLLYVPEDFSPYSGPLMSVQNSNALTKLILSKVK